MIIIDEQTVVVFNDTELATAVGCNNNINYIYFGKDIELTSGITICPSKASLIIDGTYEGVTYIFTDMNSISPLDTLGVRAASGIQITIRNMIINGRNYYGVPYITDIYNTSNLSVNYENVAYTGRQITYNINGLTRYIDCSIAIISNSLGDGNEVGEVCRVEIGGKTNITKNNGVNSVFWFRGPSDSNSLTILSDSDVTISTVNYFMYASGLSVPYTIESGARFKLSTNTGISYDSSHLVSSFLVDENASFDYLQTKSNGTNASLFISGTLTVRQGAHFFMRADYTETAPLIRFMTSVSSLNLNIENPKSFVLYKRGTPAITFQYSRPFSLSGGQVNYWENAASFPTAGTFDNPPLYQWHNPDWSGFEIKGSAASGSTTITSHTITPPVEPALSNLQLQTARVLSIGDLPLIADPVVTKDRPITGRTDPNANIKVEYMDGSTAYTLTGIADENGYFSIPTPAPLSSGMTVRISSNVPFLITVVTVIVQEAGELFIQDAPVRIRFVTPPISQTKLILRRATNDPVVIVDTRAYRTAWELMATIDGPMRTVSGHMLSDAVVYVPDRGAYEDMVPLSTDIPMSVYTGTPVAGTTNVTWDEDMGILLHVNDRLHLGEEYTANITWTVRPIE